MTPINTSCTSNDTVRLTRQIAREVGVVEPVQIVCVEDSDLLFNHMQTAISQCSRCNILRVLDVHELKSALSGVVPDFCARVAGTNTTNLNSAAVIDELCQKANVPVIIFDAAGPAYGKGRIKYFNGRLHQVPISWDSFNAVVQRTLRLCSIMIH